MTVRTTYLGGTDWGAESLTSADLNDTIENPKIKLMHTSVGTTTSTLDTELDTHTFSANNFANGDIIYVEFAVLNANESTATHEMIVRVYDGTNTADLTCTQSGQGHHSYYTVRIYNISTNTKLLAQGCNLEQGTAVSINATTMIASWIQSAFTISFRGKTSTGTLTYNWSVWKMDLT